MPLLFLRRVVAFRQQMTIMESAGGRWNSPVPLNLSSSPKRTKQIQFSNFFSNPNSALRERRQETALLIFADQATECCKKAKNPYNSTYAG